MGRHAEGWKLEWTRGEIGYVRFTHAKHQYCLSTGQKDPGKATVEAARIYAHTLAGGVTRAPSPRLAAGPLLPLFATWLDTLEGSLDPDTIRTYRDVYCRKHWPTFYRTLGEMCAPDKREAYRQARLKKAVAATVKKECWIQDKFLRWCKAAPQKFIGSTPPPLEWAKEAGTRTGPQRETPPELDVEQVEAILAKLPAWFEVGRRAQEKKPYPIRGRMAFAYETGLRPATLDLFRWGDWRETKMVLAAAADKIRYGRVLPLSGRAQEILTQLRVESIERGRSVEPGARIFGRHVMGRVLKRAASAAGVLGGGVAPYDFRHARGTHMIDNGASLTGVGFLLGHKQATTTNRYVHASPKAAERALATDLQARAVATVAEAAECVAAEVILGKTPELPRNRLLTQCVSTAAFPNDSKLLGEGDRGVSNPRRLEPQGTKSVIDTTTYADFGTAENRGKPGVADGFKYTLLESAKPLPGWVHEATASLACLLAGVAP